MKKTTKEVCAAIAAGAALYASPVVAVDQVVVEEGYENVDSADDNFEIVNGDTKVEISQETLDAILENLENLENLERLEEQGANDNGSRDNTDWLSFSATVAALLVGVGAVVNNIVSRKAASDNIREIIANRESEVDIQNRNREVEIQKENRRREVEIELETERRKAEIDNEKKNRIAEIASRQTILFKQAIEDSAKTLLARTDPRLLEDGDIVNETHKKELLDAHAYLLIALKAFHPKEIVDNMNLLVDSFLNAQTDKSFVNVAMTSHAKFINQMSAFSSALWQGIQAQARGEMRPRDAFPKDYRNLLAELEKREQVSEPKKRHQGFAKKQAIQKQSRFEYDQFLD